MCNLVSILSYRALFCLQDDDISPLEEALTTQVVHQLRDKGPSYSTSWGKACILTQIFNISIPVLSVIFFPFELYKCSCH